MDNDVGGKGGDSVAFSLALNGTGSVVANATATAGAGGDSVHGNGAQGGVANAVSSAISTGQANATATANGGAAGVGGNAPIGGGAATSTAIGTGTSGLATAIATTPGSIVNVRAQATGTVGGNAISAMQAATSIGGAVPVLQVPFNNAVANNGLAVGVGMPSAASVMAAVATLPNNAASFTPPSTFVAGAGLLAAVTPGGVMHSFDTKLDFTFAVPSGYGSTLTIGLLKGMAFNAGAFNTATDSLTLTITDNAALIFNTTFTSLLDAVTFFTDDVLTFNELFGTNDIGVDLVLSSAGNVGFQGNLLVGTVPEPSTIAILLSAILGWYATEQRRRRKAGAAKTKAA